MSSKIIIILFLIIMLFTTILSTNNKHHAHSNTHNQPNQQQQMPQYQQPLQQQQHSQQHYSSHPHTNKHSHHHGKKHRNPSQKQKFEIKDFITSVKEFTLSLITYLQQLISYLFIINPPKPTRQSIQYRQNFASQNGGAQILMVSSSHIKSPKAILNSNPDAYLFTADLLPITIVIGLKQQILIDSFVIQSGEMYSCIVQDFMLQGAFSLQKQEWILLGNFTASYLFQQQQFAVEQRIVRYIRLSILSSYGRWKYFTLSQIQVYGEGLFSHAMQSLLQADYQQHSVQNKSMNSNKSNNDNDIVVDEKQKNKKQQQQVDISKANNSKSKNNNKSHHHKDKFANKEIHTKQILVQAFTQVIQQGEHKHHHHNNKHNEKNKQQKLQQNNSNNQIHNNQQHKQSIQSNTQKLSSSTSHTSSKQKKSISNMRKKIRYLQKRNYQLHQELKQLKTLTNQKLTQLQSQYHIPKDHKDNNNKQLIIGNMNKHVEQSWYQLLLNKDFNSIIIIMYVITIVNIACLILILSKNKLFTNTNTKKSSLNKNINNQQSNQIKKQK